MDLSITGVLGKVYTVILKGSRSHSSTPRAERSGKESTPSGTDLQYDTGILLKYKTPILHRYPVKRITIQYYTGILLKYKTPVLHRCSVKCVHSSIVQVIPFRLQTLVKGAPILILHRCSLQVQTSRSQVYMTLLVS